MRCASRVISKSALVFSTALFAVGCSELRPLEGVPACEDYTATVQPIFDGRCVSCHGPKKAEGGYRLDSHQASVTRSAEGASRVVGETPALLEAAKGALTGHPKSLPDAELKTLTAWVVGCKAGPGTLKFHVRGWATPGDAEFHGATLRSTGYELTECKKCHGDDLAGGKARVSCQQCHGKEVLACQTCHGTEGNAAPPKSLSGATSPTAMGVGAHQSHLADGELHAAVTCAACHVEVTDVNQEGHFQVGGAAEDGIAEVKLANGAWDRATGTCTTGCHAPGTVDTTATNRAPHWTKVGSGEAACGTCHGAPPSTHSSETNCAMCHPTNGVDGGVVAALHVNGKVELGRALPDGGFAAPTCASCHSDGSDGFADLKGRTDTSLETVGLHVLHLTAARRISAPLTCAECHQVPAMVRDPGHIDTAGPAEAFPAGATTLARSDGAMAVFNATNATCTVYCHGAGTRAALDTSPTKVATWPWTSGVALTCGSCHGAPPSTAIHATANTLASCAQCHPSTISATGNLVLTTAADGGVTTTHLNGTVEHTP